MIEFRCKKCGQNLSVEDKYVGKKAKCKCGQIVTIPTASEAIPQPTAPIGVPITTKKSLAGIACCGLPLIVAAIVAIGLAFKLYSDYTRTYPEFEEFKALVATYDSSRTQSTILQNLRSFTDSRHLLTKVREEKVRQFTVVAKPPKIMKAILVERRTQGPRGWCYSRDERFAFEESLSHSAKTRLELARRNMSLAYRGVMESTNKDGVVVVVFIEPFREVDPDAVGNLAISSSSGGAIVPANKYVWDAELVVVTSSTLSECYAAEVFGFDTTNTKMFHGDRFPNCGLRQDVHEFLTKFVR